MQLTPQQLGAVRNGEVVRLNEEGTGVAVVLADLFDPVKDLLCRRLLSGDEDMGWWVATVAQLQKIRSHNRLLLAAIMAAITQAVEGIECVTVCRDDGPPPDMDLLTADHAGVLVRQNEEAARQRRRTEEERLFRLELEREHKAVRARLDKAQLPPCDDT